MIISYNRTLGTVCPVCGFLITEEIGPFHVLGDYSISCRNCGKAVINIKRNADKKSYKIVQECFVCGKPHTTHISHKSMWKGGLFSFGCQTTELDMAYVGKPGEVENALAELAEVFDSAARETLSQLAGEYMVIAMEILKRMLIEGRVICLCKESKIMMSVLDGEFVIYCENCRSSERIKCASESDIRALEKRKNILLR